jgi:TP901 family phage tail tape measure protein
MARDFTVTGEARLDTSRAEKELASFTRKAEKTQIKMGRLDSKQFTQPLGKITGSVTEFQKSLEASNARVIAFTASAGVLYTVVGAFREMAKAAMQVEGTLADINVILGASGKKLSAFSNQLFNVAKNTGQSFYQVGEAAAEFARQGLSMEKTVTRTRDALILMRLSGMDAESAVNSLTAAINSFNKVAINSTQIINKMANVDAAFAVSTNDLAEAIRRVGSTAESVNVTFDELISVVTSAQQTTARGGNVIGNSLKTIFTRIQRTEVVSQLEALGVRVKTMEGDMRPAMAVLKDFAGAFDKLTPSIKAQTAELVGGVYQMNILKAILKDLGKEYSVYDSALQTSLNSTDEAIKRNEELNKTMNALLNESIQNLTEFGAKVGSLTFEPVFRKLLNGFNKLSEQTSVFGDIGSFLGFDEKDANDFGGKLAKGIMGSIGNFLSGPGLIALAAIAGKLFIDFSRFLTKSVGDMMGMNKAAQEQAAIQKQISEILRNEPNLVESIKNKTASRLQVEQQIIMALKDQIKLEADLAKMSGSMAAGAQRAGIGTRTSKSSGDTRFTASRGHIPSLNPKGSEFGEYIGALQAGYKPGDIRTMSLAGEGQVTYNTNEKIKHFSGMAQPGIMPPKNSPAGDKYKEDFYGVHGFDPFNQQHAADGFIPNFLDILTSMRLGVHQRQGKQGASGKLKITGAELVKNLGPEMGAIIGHAIPAGEVVTVHTMGQQSPLSASEKEGFATGEGRKGIGKIAAKRGEQAEASLSARKGNFSLGKFRGRTASARKMDPTKLKLPYDAGEKAGGRNFPLESKPSFRKRYVAEIFKKTLYENNSSSLRHIKRRLMAKAEGGDQVAGKHLDTLQKRIATETQNRNNELTQWTMGSQGPAIGSLSQMNSTMGFDTKNAMAARREKLFYGGFIPNFAATPRLVQGGRGKQPAIWDARDSAAMLIPESGIGSTSGTMSEVSLPGTEGKKKFRFNTHDPDMGKGQRKSLHDKVVTAITKVTIDYAKKIGFPDNPLNMVPEPEKYFNTGAMKAATGSAFEAAMDAAFKRSKDVETSRWDVRAGSGKAPAIRKLFSVDGAPHADYKVSASNKNKGSMAHKIWSQFKPQLEAQLADTKKKTKSTGTAKKGGKKFSGFIPNFSPLESAFKTESALGGDPALDYDPRVGLFVRDNKTQKNASQALSDHSKEGLGKAVENSKSLQGLLAGSGFIPNFQEGTTGFDMTVITAGMGMMAFGAKDAADKFKAVSANAEALREKFSEFARETAEITSAQSEHERIIEETTKAWREHRQALEEDTKALGKKKGKADKAEGHVQRTRKGEFSEAEQRKIDRKVSAKASALRARPGGASTDEMAEGLRKEERKARADIIKAKRKLAKKHRDELKAMEGEIRQKQANKRALAQEVQSRKKAVTEIRQNDVERNKLQKSLALEANAHNRAAMTSKQVVGQQMPGVKKGGRMGRMGAMGSSMAMPAMMAMPMVGGAARAAGVSESTAGGIETGLGIASMGMMSGNPYVMAAAAVTGVIAGTFQVMKGWASETEKFSKAAEEAKEKTTQAANASQEYLKAHEAYIGAINAEDIQPQDLRNRQDALTEAMRQLPAEMRAHVAAAAASGEDLSVVFDKINKKLSQTQKDLEGGESLSKALDDTYTFMGHWMGTGGGHGEGLYTPQSPSDLKAKKNTDILMDVIMRKITPEMLSPANKDATIARFVGPTEHRTKDTSGVRAKNFAAELGTLAIDPQMIGMIKSTTNRSVVDIQRVGAALRKRMESEAAAIVETEKLARILKANQSSAKLFHKNMQAGAKALEGFHRNLKTIIDIAMMKVEGYQAGRGAQQQGLRNLALQQGSGAQQLADPFMRKIDKVNSKSDLSQFKLQSKLIGDLRKTVTGQQRKFSDVIQKKFDAASKTIVDAQLAAAKDNKAVTAKEMIKISRAEAQQKKFANLIGLAIQQSSAKPEQMMPDVFRNIKQELQGLGLTREEIDTISNEVRSLKEASDIKLASILQQAQIQTETQRLQLDQQVLIAKQQELLSFGGGASGFIGGDRIGKAQENLDKRAMAELNPWQSAHSAQGQTTEIGRQDLTMLSKLANTFHERIEPYAFADLIASSVAGLSKDITGQLDEMEKLALLGTRPDEDSKREGIKRSFGDLKAGSIDAAMQQVFAELKMKDLPINVDQIRQNTELLTELFADQGSLIQDSNERAFTKALNNVGLTRTSIIDGSKETVDGIGEFNKVGFSNVNDGIRQLITAFNFGFQQQAVMKDFERAYQLEKKGREIKNAKGPAEIQSIMQKDVIIGLYQNQKNILDHLILDGADTVNASNNLEKSKVRIAAEIALKYGAMPIKMAPHFYRMISNLGKVWEAGEDGGLNDQVATETAKGLVMENAARIEKAQNQFTGLSTELKGLQLHRETLLASHKAKATDDGTYAGLAAAERSQEHIDKVQAVRDGSLPVTEQTDAIAKLQEEGTFDKKYTPDQVTLARIQEKEALYATMKIDAQNELKALGKDQKDINEFLKVLNEKIKEINVQRAADWSKRIKTLRETPLNSPNWDLPPQGGPQGGTGLPGTTGTPGNANIMTPGLINALLPPPVVVPGYGPPNPAPGFGLPDLDKETGDIIVNDEAATILKRNEVPGKSIGTFDKTAHSDAKRAQGISSTNTTTTTGAGDDPNEKLSNKNKARQDVRNAAEAAKVAKQAKGQLPTGGADGQPNFGPHAYRALPMSAGGGRGAAGNVDFSVGPNGQVITQQMREDAKWRERATGRGTWVNKPNSRRSGVAPDLTKVGDQQGGNLAGGRVIALPGQNQGLGEAITQKYVQDNKKLMGEAGVKNIREAMIEDSKLKKAVKDSGKATEEQTKQGSKLAFILEQHRNTLHKYGMTIDLLEVGDRWDDSGGKTPADYQKLLSEFPTLPFIDERLALGDRALVEHGGKPGTITAAQEGQDQVWAQNLSPDPKAERKKFFLESDPDLARRRALREAAITNLKRPEDRSTTAMANRDRSTTGDHGDYPVTRATNLSDPELPTVNPELDRIRKNAYFLARIRKKVTLESGEGDAKRTETFDLMQQVREAAMGLGTGEGGTMSYIEELLNKKIADLPQGATGKGLSNPNQALKSKWEGQLDAIQKLKEVNEEELAIARESQEILAATKRILAGGGEKDPKVMVDALSKLRGIDQDALRKTFPKLNAELIRDLFSGVKSKEEIATKTDAHIKAKWKELEVDAGPDKWSRGLKGGPAELQGSMEILQMNLNNWFTKLASRIDKVNLEIMKLEGLPQTVETEGKLSAQEDERHKQALTAMQFGTRQKGLTSRLGDMGIPEAVLKILKTSFPKMQWDDFGDEKLPVFDKDKGGRKLFETGTGFGGYAPRGMKTGGLKGSAGQTNYMGPDDPEFQKQMQTYADGKVKAFDRRVRAKQIDLMNLLWDPSATIQEKLAGRSAMLQSRMRKYEMDYGDIFDETMEGEEAVAERNKIIDELKQLKREELSERLRKLNKEIFEIESDPAFVGHSDSMSQRRAATKIKLKKLADKDAKASEKYGIGDTFRDITASWKFSATEMAIQAEGAFFSLTEKFKSGASAAFTEAILGTKTLQEAFSDMFKNLAEFAVQQVIDMAMKRFIFNTIAGFFPAPGATGGLATNQGFKQYARGGMVNGGSGTKDDVPALLQRGEYVIRQASVKKYGQSTLDLINNQSVVKRATGGSVGVGGHGRVSGNPAGDEPMWVTYPDGSRIRVSDMEAIRRGRGLPGYTHTDPDPGLFERAQYKVDYWQHLKGATDHGGLGMSDEDIAKIRKQWELNAFADPQEGLRSRHQGEENYAEFALRNAFVYDSDKFPTLKSYYHLDNRLSRQALTDSDNPRNKIRMDKVSGLHDYHKQKIDDMAKWIEDVQEARERRNSAMKNILLMALAGTAMSYLVGDKPFGMGEGKNRNIFQRLFGDDQGDGMPGRDDAGGPGVVNPDRGGRRGRGRRGGGRGGRRAQGRQRARQRGLLGGKRNMRGGRHRKPFASGGYGGEDDIPALLTAGEYVMNRGTVEKYGIDFFSRLNRGTQDIQGYASGGYVKGQNSGRTESSQSPSSSSTENNINITVNVNGDGTATTAISGGEGNRKGAALAEMIKQSVVDTIVQEKRQGGVFSRTSSR